MARLNGGTLLIDVSDVDLTSGIEYNLTSEELKCIKEKGLKLHAFLEDEEVIIPFVVNEVEQDGGVVFIQTIKLSDGENTLRICINMTTSLLYSEI